MAAACGGICSRSIILPKRPVAVAAASYSGGTRRTTAFPPMPLLESQGTLPLQARILRHRLAGGCHVDRADLDILDTPTLMATPAQEVFDRDRFKSDDKMGNAILSLQPIVSASKLKLALQLSAGETKLRKVVPSPDNCLLEDSFVTYVNGEIVQNVRLRLCDVECGELYVTIKWIDNPSGTNSA